jgi:hypothetical protein
MALCSSGLPICCCQPAVVGGFIYADLRGELNTHLAPHALFTQNSPVWEPPLQAFSFPSTLGEVTLYPLSQACMFIYSSHGKWVFPSLLWSFPPTTTFTSFLAPGYWACSAAPAFSSQLVYLQFCYGFPSPPSLVHVFFVVIAYYSVSLFLPGWGSACPGGYADLAQGCLWGYHIPLSSPCGLHLLKPSGHWRLVVRQPSLFLHLM